MVFRLLKRLKLLTYLRESNLSSEDALALMRRLETDTCRREDYEVLIRLMRAHTKLSVEDREAFAALEERSATRVRRGQGPSATKARRRRRGSSG